MMNAFLPNSCVRGMKLLNKEMFSKTVQVPAIRVQAKKCGIFRERFKKKLLRHPKIKGIQDCADDNQSKVMLLQPDAVCDTEGEWIKSNGGTSTTMSLELTYDHFSIHEVLQAVLPSEEVKEIPSSFETVGHIAHLNLQAQQLPYKELIGNVILDKLPRIETVVNKLASIDETFRFFKMEVLAGKPDTIATVHENGCAFTFDFSKVYWNSRLHTEHERIVNILKPGDVVLDMFAGVGPFAIPACRKGCTVYANDLNPVSYQYLVANAATNKVKERLHPYCLDGRLFVRNVVEKLLVNYKDGCGQVISHVIMNLPMSAVEFLDVFKGLFTALPFELRPNAQLPRVHCYCFSKAIDNLEQDSVQLVQSYLGTELDAGTYNVHVVRDVSPNKRMIRVSFDLPPSIAYSDCDSPGIEPCDTDVENQGRKRAITQGESDEPPLPNQGSPDCVDHPSSAKKVKL